ncbi:MAG TPA: hypothetical protein VHS31_06190 [Tepidisphaeraceae bacterium]|nr:hypothetical protein [Tepidisphaeraceae bacterium]
MKHRAVKTGGAHHLKLVVQFRDIETPVNRPKRQESQIMSHDRFSQKIKVGIGPDFGRIAS